MSLSGFVTRWTPQSSYLNVLYTKKRENKGKKERFKLCVSLFEVYINNLICYNLCHVGLSFIIITQVRIKKLFIMLVRGERENDIYVSISIYGSDTPVTRPETDKAGLLSRDRKRGGGKFKCY